MASDTVVIWELPPPIEKLHKVRADVVVHTCNPGIWEVETEALEIGGHLEPLLKVNPDALSSKQMCSQPSNKARQKKLTRCSCFSSTELEFSP